MTAEQKTEDMISPQEIGELFDRIYWTLSPSASLKEILPEICSLMEDRLNLGFVWVMLAGDGGDILETVAFSGDSRGMDVRAVTYRLDGRDNSLPVRAVSSREPLMTVSGTGEFSLLDRMGYGNVVAIPLAMKRDGGGVMMLFWNGDVLSEESLHLLSLLGKFVSCLVGTSIEAGELRRSLREEEGEREFLQALLDVANILIVIMDAQGRVLKFNRKCQEVTGYSESEVAGDSVFRFIPPEELEGVEDVWKRTLGGERTEYRNHWLHRDGGRRLIHWHNLPFRKPYTGEMVVISTGIDITETEDIYSRLESSERAVSKMLTSMPVMVFEVDREGKVLFANTASERITGYTREEISNTTWWGLLFPGDLRQEAVSLLEAVRGGGVVEREVILRTKDGEERGVLLYAAPLYVGGEGMSIVGVGVD
ncbi:MAG: PAS domain-containing protein, partial [Thermoplasmata archaeon]|nr:PAS domain-containing protein [Thermoplasmata archaeon]